MDAKEMFLGYFMTVVGLVCFFEGLPYLACPGQLKRVMQQVMTMSSRRLRILGWVLMVMGLAFVYWGRRHGG